MRAMIRLCVSLAATFLVALPAAAAPKPNIVVILVDDMGFSDLGCYGSEIPTPNLDRLAAGGLRFTQFYNTGRCCPTRASLLTGLYPHQAGVGHMVEDRGQPGYQGHLNDRCVTLPEVLKPAGYFTAMVGKWHVGQHAGVVPWTRGFERSLNAPAGGFYRPDCPRAELFLNGQKVGPETAGVPKDWYTTDLWTDFGLKFVDEALATNKPFFLYVAHNAPHFPLQADSADIARFIGTYKAGWDRLREERHTRQIEMGLVDKSWPLAPRPSAVAAWDSLTDEQRERFDRIMAVYAATVWRMDRAIGQLVDGLKSRGVLDNTLILFMSDNGGNAEAGPGGKTDGDPTDAKSNWFCGESWALLENTPFRRYKHFNHEGGIATPLIAHWPAHIKEAGALRKQPGHLIDVMATLVDVSGASYPAEFNGKPILPMEGRSLVPAFEDKPFARDALFWEHEGNAAVRVGDSKLVRQGRQGPWELYDLAKDRTEQRDMSKAEPGRVKELAAKWNEWAKRAQVIPYPDDKKAAKKMGGAGPIRVTAKRGDVSVAPPSNGVAMASVRGDIGSASLEPANGRWPSRVLLRLHLRGLEQLSLCSGDERLALSYLSHSGNPTLLHLWKGNAEGPALQRTSPYWTEVKVFDAAGRSTNGLPPEGGWFEVEVPLALLRDGQPLAVDWIDFFRR